LDTGEIEVGTVQEASAAVARLLAVTHATYERRAQLEHALESRVAIEQAKGIIAERYGLGLDEAFEAIRRVARHHRMKLHDLVRTIEPAQTTPPELASFLDQEQKNV
jgi:AmiR/NasT family two-component response regulator